MKKVLILSFECLYIHISVKKNYQQSGMMGPRLSLCTWRQDSDSATGHVCRQLAAFPIPAHTEVCM